MEEHEHEHGEHCRCEFDHDDYSLNIIELPQMEGDEDIEVEEPESDDFKPTLF